MPACSLGPEVVMGLFAALKSRGQTHVTFVWKGSRTLHRYLQPNRPAVYNIGLERLQKHHRLWTLLGRASKLLC